MHTHAHTRTLIVAYIIILITLIICIPMCADIQLFVHGSKFIIYLSCMGVNRCGRVGGGGGGGGTRQGGASRSPHPFPERGGGGVGGRKAA